VKSILKKKKKNKKEEEEEEEDATVGTICRKGRFQACNERVSGRRMMRVASRWNRRKKCHSTHRTGYGECLVEL